MFLELFRKKNTHTHTQTFVVMSADNCGGNVSLPLRNLLNSIQSIRDRVRDGESNETDGPFNLSNFWDTLNQAVKAVSHEATKLSLAFSKPPLPSQQDVETLSESILKSVLSLSTVFYWLPKSQGVSLRRRVRDATVGVLEGVEQLVEVILSAPLQSLSQEQLISTGSVWSACDHFAQLPRDNKAAVLMVLSDQIGIVKDAIEEIEQALSEAQDPFSDVLDVEQEPRGNQDSYWSQRDRRVVGPCRGLMKAAAACLRKLTAAVKANGDVSTPHNLAQLDDLADVTKEISPGLDDLVLCLYPPMEYSGVESHVCTLAALLRKVLQIIRSSHVCAESQLTWVQFLEEAVDHNQQRAKDLMQQDS
ncbi:cyclin-D1-binding protein 1 homolog [Clinocottus analis]|uniref:cyclin-D1-binding protein 1 homolog n=1 Tax=Clinocottus analis TaxID=304258 RepID=UPI0035BF89C1